MLATSLYCVITIAIFVKLQPPYEHVDIISL